MQDDLVWLEKGFMEIQYMRRYLKDDKLLKSKEIVVREKMKKCIKCSLLPKRKKLRFLISLVSFRLYFFISQIRMNFIILHRLLRYRAIHPQKICINEKKKLIYVVNPKVANTSLNTSLYELKAKEYYIEIHQQVNCSGQTRMKIKKGEYQDCYVFSFVRNPYLRLISCYENKYHSDKKLLGKTLGCLHFDNYLLGYLRKDCGFEKFAKKVANIPDCLSDFHFKSQYATLYIKGRGLPDYIGKFENLAEDFEPLRQKYDLAPLPHYNSTAKERGGKNWMDYYDLHTAELVYKRYKKDFEVFGYEDEYHNLIAYLKAKEA